MSHDDHVHRKHITPIPGRKQAGSCNGWTTQLKGVAGCHTALFEPYEDSGNTFVRAMLPNLLCYCFVQGKQRTTFKFPLNTSQPETLLREACKMAAESCCELLIHTPSLSQLEKAVSYVEWKLPLYKRVPLERINGKG